MAVAGFASLTDGGRYRLEVDARLKRELVKDFHATLRGYESYDSRPATEGAPTRRLRDHLRARVELLKAAPARGDRASRTCGP